MFLGCALCAGGFLSKLLEDGNVTGFCGYFYCVVRIFIEEDGADVYIMSMTLTLRTEKSEKFHRKHSTISNEKISDNY